MLIAYGVTDSALRQELESLARDGQKRAWWSRYSDALPESYNLYIGLEAAAVSQRIYSNAVVPGLLQTGEYCRATMRQGLIPAGRRRDEINKKRVEVRLKRQEQMRMAWPRLDVILDESVLLRPLGGVAVLRDQLSHLLRLADHPAVHLRVLPFAHYDRIVFPSTFTLLGFASDPDVAYIETAAGGVYPDQSEIDSFASLFRQMKEVALDEEASADFIRGARARIST